MQIETPLHAEHQLDQLVGQFERWRQSRTHSSAPFPKRSGIRPSRWPRFCPPARGQTVTVAPHRPEKTDGDPIRGARDGVSQVPGLGGSTRVTTPSWPPPTGALQIELSRADGSRLCIHGVEATLPLAVLVRAFVEGRSCCS